MKTRILLFKHTCAVLVALVAFFGCQHALRANLHASSETKAAEVLNRREILLLESIAHRAESMMTLMESVPTRVWAHGVRDQRGRLGLFVGCARPLFGKKDQMTVKQYREWIVCSLIAVVKYSEGSPVGHIGFTDVDGLNGQRWYYDLDMATAREIHRLIITGMLPLHRGYDMIVRSWEKVTVDHGFAVR